MSNNNLKVKKSLWGEFNYASVSVIALLVGLMILSVSLLIFMSQPTKKVVSVTDDANIFSESELEELESLASDLSKSDDISVVIITTRNKKASSKEGKYYTNSDDACNQFAADYYTSEVIGNKFQDNSGICILVDLSLDYSGGRYFRIFTYGTAYYAISNSDCNYIFGKYKASLSNGEYAYALKNVLKDVKAYTFSSFGLFIVSNLLLLGAIPLALLFTKMFTRRRKLDKIPPSTTYTVSRDTSEFKDIYLRQSVKTVHVSSSSGGGGFSGGGGGGHSGGGGGRF